MSLKKLVTSTLLGIALLAGAASASAQEVVGPPPQERANMQAFQKAFNTSAAEYELMAKKVFSADHYKNESPEKRKSEYDKLRDYFGDIQFQQVNKDGPDAPLEVSIKGTKKSGKLWIQLDDDSRVMSIRAEMK